MSKLITLEELADFSDKVKARFESAEDAISENTTDIRSFDTTINLHTAQIALLQTAVLLILMQLQQLVLRLLFQVS